MAKTETVNTKVTAEKIEGSAIGKGNKASSVKLDGPQVVLIILTIGFLVLLVIAAVAFVISKGQINLFPDLEPIFKQLISFN